MSLINWLKMNLESLLEIIKAFLTGKTIVKKKHYIEIEDSWQIPNSAIVIIYTLIIFTLGFIARFFGL